MPISVVPSADSITSIEVTPTPPPTGGSGATLEQVQDNLGNTFLVAGTSVETSYDDQAGTLTIGVTASDFATPSQGDLADTAVQPDDLATVATTGAYSDLSGTPALGTAAATASTAYDAAGSAASAQAAAESTAAGALTTHTADTTSVHGIADTSALLVSGDIGTTVAGLVAGTVPDGQLPSGLTRDTELADAISAAIDALLAGAPGALNTLNELAASIGDDADFAGTVTAALAGKQPLDSDLTAIAALTTTTYGRSFLALASSAAGRALLELAVVAGTGAYSDLSGLPTLGTAAATPATDYATASQGALAATATQPGDLGIVATSNDYDDLDNLPTAGDIKTAYESNDDTNVFDDDNVTKLNGIEAGADVTSASNIGAAGGIIVVDSPTAVARPSTSGVVWWLDDDTNAVDGDIRITPS